jgi:L-ascorbate metabolism protein UlaG (beta-lactamase superfamily)
MYNYMFRTNPHADPMHDSCLAAEKKVTSEIGNLGVGYLSDNWKVRDQLS